MDLELNTTRLNSFLDQLAPLRRRRARFLFAAAAVAISLVLTAVAQSYLGSTSAVIFAIAVVFCTGFFGLIAGLFTAVAAVLTLDYFYIRPLFEISFDPITLRIAVIFSVLAGCTHLVERRISGRIRSDLKPPLGVHGSLDGLVDGELYGWALDADVPAEPVNVTVFLDRHPVACVAAVHYRPDVAERMNCSGSHGFYVDLAPYLLPEREVAIDVRLPNGRSIANAPLIVRTSATTPRAKRPTVLFMHIPKTAGTALREAMTANYRQSEIAYLYTEPPGFLVRDLRALPLEQRRAYRLVIGHFQFWMHEALPQQSDYITIVREPGARVLSQYAYTRQTQPELVARSDGGVMSLPDLCEKRLTVNFDNAMVRCFSGVDQNDFPPGKLTREVYELAVHHLHTAFAFVGHQEDLMTAYAVLSRQYGWQAIQTLPYVNVGTVRPIETERSEVLAAIQHYNRWDYLLYGEILKRFPLEGLPFTDFKSPRRNLVERRTGRERRSGMTGVVSGRDS